YVGCLLWGWFYKPLFSAVAIAAPLAVIVVTNPRLALYQYVFVLFLHYDVISSVPIFLTEVSAVLVILAAILDLLLHLDHKSSWPPLTWNYLLIVGALVLAGFFGYDPSRAVRPVLRVSFLLVTFLSLYRLSRHLEITHLAKFFFAVCVANSVVVIGQFVESGGAVRVFGFAWLVFDELAMLALPIGVAFFIWAERGKGLKYLIGSVPVAGALLATQSRAPIIFGFLVVAIGLFMSSRRAKITDLVSNPEGRASRKPVRRRVGLIVGVLATVLIALTVSPGMLEAMLGRFERLITVDPAGTFLLRVTLWKTAITTFWDHPLLGIGPGMFKHIHELYSSVHLDPTFYWVRGKSAHNLLLHYLAETGLVGAAALLALFIQQFRLARRNWLPASGSDSIGTELAIYLVALLFLLTTILEAGWMWGQMGFMAVFFSALIARSSLPYGKRHSIDNQPFQSGH
ncbi:MAG: O-antigen ligase family protein, partial [Planctomycetota bacterium]